MSQVLIRQGGPFIQVSPDGEAATPPALRRILEEPLYYTYLDFKHGADAYCPITGRHQPVDKQRRRLFQYDERGRFVCQRGFRPKIEKLLRERGYDVFYQNVDPPKDPKVYEPDFDRVFEKFEFKPEQDTCLAQIAMHEYGVIDAVPAFGKGYLIPMVCCLFPKAKIDIVTKRKDVVNTLVGRLNRYIAAPGKVGAGRRRKGRVTVYTVDSLHHSDFDADILLVDEIHELMTDNYARQLSRYWHARIYGFTATTRTRADNAHERMEGIAGPVIFHMDQPTAERLGIVVPVVVQWLDVEMDWNPALGLKSLAARKRHGIWSNQYRNGIIAAAAQQFYEEDHQTLIAVETVEHALYLRQFLPNFTLCYSEQALADEKKRNKFMQAGIFDYSIPPMTPQRRDQLRRDFEARRILGAIATGVWTVGVSFDSLQALFRVEGGESETASVQTPGRVCRVDNNLGKEVGFLLDCYDKWDEKFRQTGMTRRRAYAARGWTQYNGDGSIWAPRQRGKRVQL